MVWSDDAYRAATHGLAVFERSGRARLLVSGREPRQMLQGILTGALPAEPATSPEGVRSGTARYSAVLTPKGKMVSDVWVSLLGADGDGFLLDAPSAGAQPLLEHFGTYLPPRFATLHEVSAETAMVSVVGPSAPASLSRLALASKVSAEALEALEEGAWRAVEQPEQPTLTVMRSCEVWPVAFNVIGPTQAVRALRDVLLVEDAAPAEDDVWTTLRVEAGRPEFGRDMTADTIPTEAGIEGRAIDETKGCYTGQEVIVRIRDRGHVNRRLRLLRLGDAPVPDAGTELFAEEGGKPMAWVTSAVWSPRDGEVLALAYVRRGAERLLYEGRAVDVPEEG